MKYVEHRFDKLCFQSSVVLTVICNYMFVPFILYVLYIEACIIPLYSTTHLFIDTNDIESANQN